MSILTGRKQLFFWITAALIAISLVIALFLLVRRPPTTRGALYIVGNPENGAMLFYGDKQCGICHSVNGSGGRIAPELSGQHPGRPAMGWLATALWNHGPSMWRLIRQKSRPYPELNAQEMADILAFLYQANSIDQPGNPHEGQKVFNEKGCSRCHSVGGKVAPELSTIAAGGEPNAWTGAMLNHADSMVGPITSTLGEWPQFSGHEMTDLIAYVGASGSRAANSGRELHGDAQLGWTFFQNRCMECHSVRGQGGRVGPELGPEQDLPLTPAQFGSVMWNHAPAMLRQAHGRGFPPTELQSQDIANLLAFLTSLRYFEPTGSPSVGQRVFAERGCATCHGATAEGTKTGPRIKPGGEAYTTVSFTAALWRHGPSMTDRAEELGLAWPTLEPNDIGNLVSFLNAPSNPKP